MSSGILQGTHDVVLNNVELYDNSSRFETNQTINNVVDGDKGTGIKELRRVSMPDASYDSSARDPPPHCHPGTRQDVICKIVSWAGGISGSNEHIIWMQGPAGVGKSAVAQSSAEVLAEQKKLGAAFFFSRPNSRDDPKCLFPSISYQITTMWDAYAEILDSKIRRDPTIVEKSLKVQFRELLVKPLRELAERGEGNAEAMTIIIDGFDECAGIDSQHDIIDIITTSVRDETTPFRWALFSRPESHIRRAFLSDRLLPLSLQVELPVSREIDHEILSYLTAELKKIREEHGLSPSWPSERDLGTLVDLSAGLFIYASTVVRFVRERNSSGPLDQLCAVVLLARSVKGKASTGHPLSELDLFYTLIMRNVPSKILPTILKISLFYTLPALNYSRNLGVIANVLGLTQPQINNACATLSSVLEFRGWDIEFYHASFLEFMQDPNRSKEFCPQTSCLGALDGLRRELLERINDVHAHSQEGSVEMDITWSIRYFDKADLYYHLLNVFFGLCQSHPLDLPTTVALVDFPFQMIPCLSQKPYVPIGINPISLKKNIPIEFRHKVVRRSHSLIGYLCRLVGAGENKVYILGHGKNKVFLYRQDQHWKWC